MSDQFLIFSEICRYAFNLGSVFLFDSNSKHSLAALVMANTTLAGASAGVTTLFIDVLIVRLRTGKASYDLIKTMNGALCGLASITGGCAGKSRSTCC